MFTVGVLRLLVIIGGMKGLMVSNATATGLEGIVIIEAA